MFLKLAFYLQGFNLIVLLKHVKVTAVGIGEKRSENSLTLW